MEPVRRGAVDGLEGGVLIRHQRQYAGTGIRGEYGPFECRVVPVPGRQSIRPGTLPSRLVLETGVGGIVDVEARHLVHAHHEIDGVSGDMVGDALGESPLPDMAADTSLRQHDDLDTVHAWTFPLQRVDPHPVSPLPAPRHDLHQVPGRSPMGKEFEDGERDVHGSSSTRRGRRDHAGRSGRRARPRRGSVPPPRGTVARNGQLRIVRTLRPADSVSTSTANKPTTP